ncbi:hypothetical protein LOAG_06094 [Loa loa]|uniref:Uncharacterized protein n=2 Tax=Loa loa TaxID=7209 RepID=A0A1S0TYN6_LOALO|nr:hypothetical protein LOAG_06094 [Loa loa]EFO22391.1 hypothetical protein LOAG_06094 [Loa loa]
MIDDDKNDNNNEDEKNDAKMLVLITVYASANVAKQQCCNLYSTEFIQRNDDYLKNIIGSGSDSNGDNDNNSSIDATDEYKLINCKAQCDAQWKSNFHEQAKQKKCLAF